MVVSSPLDADPVGIDLDASPAEPDASPDASSDALLAESDALPAGVEPLSFLPGADGFLCLLKRSSIVLVHRSILYGCVDELFILVLVDLVGDIILVNYWVCKKKIIVISKRYCLMLHKSLF